MNTNASLLLIMSTVGQYSQGQESIMIPNMRWDESDSELHSRLCWCVSQSVAVSQVFHSHLTTPVTRLGVALLCNAGHWRKFPGLSLRWRQTSRDETSLCAGGAGEQVESRPGQHPHPLGPRPLHLLPVVDQRVPGQLPQSSRIQGALHLPSWPDTRSSLLPTWR